MEEGDAGLGLGEIFGVLRRHKWLILATTAVCALLTGYLLSQEVTYYRANALVRIVDDRGVIAGDLGGSAQSAGGARVDPLQSQLLVLRGQDVLGPVVEQQGLRLVDAASGVTPGWMRDVVVELPAEQSAQLEVQFGSDALTVRSDAGEARAGYGDTLRLPAARFVVPERPEVLSASLVIVPRLAAVTQVASGISAGPREGTDAMDIGFVSTDPQLATRVTNAVVEQFQLVNAAAAKQLSTRRRLFLRDQLRETDSLLAIAQANLIAFRNEERVYGSQQQLGALAGGILQLETRRQELDADRRLYESLFRRLQSHEGTASETELAALVSAPQLAANPLVSQLYAERRGYVVQRDSLTVRAGRSPSDGEVMRLNTLIAHSDEKLAEAVRSQLQLVEARIASIDELKARSEQEFQRLPAVEAEEARLSQQVGTLQSIGDQLRTEFQRARIAEAVEAGRVEVLNPATRAVPVPGRGPMKMMLGMMLGLFLGSGGAFLLENMNSSIRRRQDLPETLHIPELGVIPAARPKRVRWAGKGRKDPPAVTLENRALVSESYRMLRTNLTHRPDLGSLRLLAITSASSGEGKSTTAANLAVSFAQQGARVLLVDCDLWRSRLARVMNVPESPGLADLLEQRSSLEESIHPSAAYAGLDVLPCGTKPGEVVELLNTRRMDQLLGRLREHYDLLILDTPPVLAVADSAALASRADGVLLVVRAGDTDREVAQAAVRQLTTVGAHIVGGVLNDPDAELPRYGDYYATEVRGYAAHA